MMGAENIWQLIGNIIIGLGLAFMLFGVVLLFIQRDFYFRILVASKIDTIGLFSFIIGFAFRHGISFFTGKLFIILVIMLVLNPFVAHVLASYAHKSGYKAEGTQDTRLEEETGGNEQ
ncbi:MAG: monovalent cation/H(+) antiporter subunit G [Defluviitaleaceae bacterium]|nr:monovalent cation/H(+) antiporter subunit G [Defluviitaleaceae bacterium]